MLTAYALVACVDQGLHYLSPAGNCHEAVQATHTGCSAGCRHEASPFAAWRRAHLPSDTAPMIDGAVSGERSACGECLICQSLRQLVSHSLCVVCAPGSSPINTRVTVGPQGQAPAPGLRVSGARGPPAPRAIPA